MKRQLVSVRVYSPIKFFLQWNLSVCRGFAMTGDEIHQWIAEQSVKQRRKPEPRPQNMTENQFKNRYLISSKLPPNIYSEFLQFCRDNNYSVNSAIVAILTHFLSNVESDCSRISEQRSEAS